MVGSYLEKGESPRGEARAELQEIISAGTRYAEETVRRERFPADYKKLPQRYFERILEN